MLHGLKSLGIDTTSWDAIVIYVVSQKLDTETRKQWEAKVSEINSNSNILPDFNQLKDFLQHRFHSLEFLGIKVNKDRPIVNPLFSNNFHVSQVTCSFCKGDHRIISCKGFINLDNNTKRTFVKDNHLCYNCLSANHGVRYCRISTSCQICKRRHHSLLHSDGARTNISLGPVASGQVSAVVTTGGEHLSQGSALTSMLSTVIGHNKQTMGKTSKGNKRKKKSKRGIEHISYGKNGKRNSKFAFLNCYSECGLLQSRIQPVQREYLSPPYFRIDAQAQVE